MLKLGITRVNDIVIGRVLEQSEDLRDEDILVELAENNWVKQIRSASNPELYVDAILFVRGCDSAADNEFFALPYPNKDVAIEVIADIRRLVAKLNHSKEDNLVIGLEIVE